MTRWLAAPLEPLSRMERRLLIWTSVIVAITRVYAAARSMWEWDEALFALAMRNYDITNHRPHPPGFPLFIGLAHIPRLVVGSDFRALQIVTVAAAIALFPLLFLLARELRFGFWTSYLAALLFVFFPNVWLFGGTAFSDVPALALTLAAAAMFARSVRERRAFVPAAVLLGMALSIRPQNIILAVAPALLGTAAMLRVSWKRAMAGVLAGLAVVTISYGAAALASESLSGYASAMQSQEDYVRRIDSAANTRRPPLSLLVPDFITRPMRGADRATALEALIIIGIIATIAGVNRGGGVTALLMFVPMMLFSWVMLDMAAVTRYTVTYVAGHALFAAHGAAWISRLAKRYSVHVQAVAIAILTAAYGSWAFPAIREVRRNEAPTAAVMEAVARYVPPNAPLYVHEGLAPFANYFLEEHGRSVLWFDASKSKPKPQAGAWMIVDSYVSSGDGKVFTREDGRTWQIARRRYYVTSVVPLAGEAHFGAGWYQEEPYGLRNLRWMGERAEIVLPPSAKRTLLSIDVAIPTPLIDKRPVVTVTVNGRPVGQFVCTRQYEQREWVVEAKPDGANVVALATSQVINPAREKLGPDTRDLGLQLRSYVWRSLGSRG